MTVKFTNNASTTVATGINSSVTSLTVTSASAFPSLSGANDYCYLTIAQATGAGIEVVKATALSTNTFTIVRAQDNTTAQAFSAGDKVELRMTAALLTDVIDASSVDGVKTNFQYTPTAGQTVFSGADNSSNTLVIQQAGLVNVYMNGVRLVQGTDYSVSVANNSITLTVGATTADIIDIEVYGNFTGQSGSAVAITGGAISGTSVAATTLSASGTATLNTFVSNNSTISGGTINNVAIGGTTKAAGSFTSITADAGIVVTGNVTANPSGGVITLGASGQITSKQSLDVATAGGRFIGSSNRGILGQIRIEQTANSTDGGYIEFDTCASGSTSPTSRMHITSAGLVGIGDTPATARLEVHGAFGYASGANSLATTVSKASARIRGSSDASTSLFFGSLTNDAEQYIQSSNGTGTGADDLALNPHGGNVGIGRVPSERLDVDGVIQINRTGDHPAIRFMEDGTTRGYMGSGDWAVTGGATGDFGISSVGNLLFGTSAGAERFRIDSTGNLTGSCFHATTSEYVGNLDNLKTTGFYRSQNNTTNNPSYAYYSVIVYGNQGNVTAQIATLLSGPATYVRSFNTVWTSWVRIDD